MNSPITPGDEHLEGNIIKLMSSNELRLVMPESGKARVLSTLLGGAAAAQPVTKLPANPDLTTNTQAHRQAAVRLVGDVPAELADGVPHGTRRIEQTLSRRHVPWRVIALLHSKKLRWSAAGAVAAAVVLLIGFWPGNPGRRTDQSLSRRAANPAVVDSPTVAADAMPSKSGPANSRSAGGGRTTSLLRVDSLEDQVAAAGVILVATLLDHAPVQPKQPGDLVEAAVRFRVTRVLKGDFSDQMITLQGPFPPADEEISKDWILLLSPRCVAGEYPYAGRCSIKAEPEIQAILSGGRPAPPPVGRGE